MSLKPYGRPTKTDKWSIRTDPVTPKQTSWQDKLEQGSMFSHMLTRVCHTGSTLATRLLLIRTNIYLCISSWKKKEKNNFTNSQIIRQELRQIYYRFLLVQQQYIIHRCKIIQRWSRKDSCRFYIIIWRLIFLSLGWEEINRCTSKQRRDDSKH